MNPTPEQVAQWAREAGFQPHRSGKLIAMHSNGSWVGLDDEIKRLVTLACAWQAEQDAAVCEGLPAGTGPHAFAFAIRANAPKGTT